MLINAQSELCNAIRKRVLVNLRYDDDYTDRTFAPHIVYESSQGNILVAGTQDHNPAEPWEDNKPRNFDLDKITSLEVTGQQFLPHPGFNRSHKRYVRPICNI
jgi:hypothetical protein